MNKLKIAIAGKNSIAVNAVDHLLDDLKFSPKDIFGLCNRNDDGLNTWQPSFKRYLQEREIQEVNQEELFEIENLLFISLEFDRLVKTDKFKTDQIFNIHFSMLPAYKGMYTSAWPLLNGEKYSGVTLHKIDPGIDTGNIIAQSKFEIKNEWNALDVYSCYLSQGLNLIKANLESLILKSYSEMPQESEGSSYYSKSSINYSDLKLDLNQTAFNIQNQIRAFSFRFYQMASILGRPVYGSEIQKSRSNKKPGSILSEDEFTFTISTVDYDLQIKKDLLNQLFDAAKSDELSEVKRIVDSGFPLNEKDGNGWDVLILAAYNGSRKVFDFLLDQNFDIQTRNFKGTDLYMYAFEPMMSKGDSYYLEALAKRKLNPNRKDQNGKSAFDWANEKCPEAIQILNKAL